MASVIKNLGPYPEASATPVGFTKVFGQTAVSKIMNGFNVPTVPRGRALPVPVPETLAAREKCEN